MNFWILKTLKPKKKNQVEPCRAGLQPSIAEQCSTEPARHDAIILKSGSWQHPPSFAARVPQSMLDAWVPL